MNVFISVDMEGVACVVHTDDVKLEGPAYEAARKWITGEVNAAIEGALEAGATQVVVNEAHGHMRNLLPDELNEQTLLIRGSPKPLCLMEGIGPDFDAVFLVGYHAMAGTARGVLVHSFSGRRIYAVRLNDISVGEVGFIGALAGHFGVPVALASGDRALATEVERLMPWAERVVVKEGISMLAARNLVPKAAQKAIREGAKRALAQQQRLELFTFAPPIRLEVDFFQPFDADLAQDIPGVTRVGDRAVAYTGTDMVEVTKVLRVIMNVGQGDFFV